MRSLPTSRIRASLALSLALLAGCASTSPSSASPMPSLSGATPAGGLVEPAHPGAVVGIAQSRTDSRPSPSPPPVPVPPKPSGVSFHEKRKGDDAASTKITQTVKWAVPRTRPSKSGSLRRDRSASPSPRTRPRTPMGHVWSSTPRCRRRFASCSPPRRRRTALSVGRGQGRSTARRVWHTTLADRLTTPSCLLPTARQATRPLPLPSLEDGRNPVLTTSFAHPRRGRSTERRVRHSLATASGSDERGVDAGAEVARSVPRQTQGDGGLIVAAANPPEIGVGR